MKLKKYFYSYFFFVLFILFLVDEISFILYNISLYQIFCGSNFIKIYESFFKLPIASLNTLNIQVMHQCNSNHTIFNIYNNVNCFNLLNTNNSVIENTIQLNEFSSANNYIQNNNSTDNIYLVHFDTLTTQKNKIEFEILQNKIYISPGESTLAFFRISNTTDETLQAFSIYVVSPTEYTPFINKLQCFCYEELLLYPNETIDLPVLFRIEPDILRIDNLNKEIVIEYIIVL